MIARTGAFHQFEQLLKHFEITEPFTKQQVKSAYLKKIKQLHPDVNCSPDAKLKFVQVQDEYHQLEKFLSSRQFLGEWEQYKRGLRSTSSFDDPGDSMKQQHWQQQQQETRTPFRSESYREASGSGRERYYYYHYSSPFTKPTARDFKDDPFELYRKYYDEKLRNNPETKTWQSKHWKHGLYLPFFLNPQFLFFFTFVLPLFIMANFNRRRATRYSVIDDERWKVSREIKTHLWGELGGRDSFPNRPLTPPTSTLLLSIDDDQPVHHISSVPRTSRDAIDDKSQKHAPTNQGQVDRELSQNTDSSFKPFSKVEDGVKGNPVKNPDYHQPLMSTDERRHRGKSWDGSEVGLFYQFGPSVLPDMISANQLSKPNGGKRKDGYPDRKHRTALHYAAYSGQTDICRLLILYNGNPLALDGFQETPIDAARQAGWKETERLLVFAASGSYKLALELASNPDPRLRYSQLFASTVAASLGSYIPPDLQHHMVDRKSVS